MVSLCRGALVFITLCFCLGCQIGTSTIEGDGAISVRTGDGLLSNPELQAIVDLQVDRDALGLAEMLSARDPSLRARAAFALGSIQEPSTFTILASRLQSEEEAVVRRDIAFAIGQLNNEASVPILADVLVRETEHDVRYRILEALGKVGSVSASEALLSADVVPEEEPLRVLALAVSGAVTDVNDVQSRDLLFSKLDDPNADIRVAAAYYFGRVTDTSLWSSGVSRLREVLDLYAEDEPAALHLIVALGRLGDDSDVERLIRWAGAAQDWRVRAEAIAGLSGRESQPEVLETLLNSLDDSSEHVAARAAIGIASRNHSPEIITRIKSWIDSDLRRVSVTEPLLQLLGRQNEGPFIFGWLDSLQPDDLISWKAGVSALSQISGIESLQRLSEAAQSSYPEVNTAVVQALARRWPRDRQNPEFRQIYFDLFSGAVQSDDAGVYRTGLEMLTDPFFGELGSAGVLGEVYRESSAGSEIRKAVEILGLIAITGDPDAHLILREALGHPSGPIRRTAAMELERLTGEVSTVDIQVDDGLGLPPEVLPVTPSYDPAQIDWRYLRRLGEAPELVTETTRGRIRIRMFTEHAPHTVQTIARLSEEGRYDGVAFHRVIPNFVVQGGDVEGLSGMGGPGFEITTELNGIPFQRGSVGMARLGKDTEGSQFFIAHTMLPHLDGGYTVFGRVVEGMDIVDQITQDDLILSVEVEVRD